MNSDDLIWANRIFFTHYDNSYDTKCKLDLNLTTNTRDYINFSQLTLQISITSTDRSNNSKYLLNLNYFDISSLYSSIKSIISDVPINISNNSYIFKKYNNKCLKIGIKKSDKYNENLVIIAIINNNNDYGMIALSNENFANFTSLINTFINDYINIHNNLINSFNIIHLTQKVYSIDKEIKTLNSKFNNICLDNKKENNIDIIDDSSEEENIVNEKQNSFESFIGENIDSIVLENIINDDLTISKKLVRENKIIESKLYEDFLKNNINNIDNYFHTLSMQYNQNSFYKFIDDISLYFDIDSNKNNSNKDIPPIVNYFLPGITYEDLKSYIYISKTFLNCYLKIYAKSIDKPINLNLPFLKFRIDSDNITSDHIKLAYDLLLIISFIRLVVNKLKNDLSDPLNNKSLLYLTLRSFLDPLYLSILHGKDEDLIINCISDRFKYYENKGFFDSYQNLISSYGYTKINISELLSYVKNVVLLENKKEIFISELHANFSSKNYLCMNKNNNLNLEQILDELSPLEISIKLMENVDLNSLNISDEVKKIFNNIQKKEDLKSQFSLYRYINSKISEIKNENLKDKLLEKVSKLENTCFDFINNIDIPIIDLSESILKALFIWDPTNDKSMVNNYNYFLQKVSSITISKELIISNINSKSYDEENKNSGDWLSGIDLALD